MTPTSLAATTVAVGTCGGCARIVDVLVFADGASTVVSHDDACPGTGRPPRGRIPHPRG